MLSRGARKIAVLCVVGVVACTPAARRPAARGSPNEDAAVGPGAASRERVADAKGPPAPGDAGKRYALLSGDGRVYAAPDRAAYGFGLGGHAQRLVGFEVDEEQPAGSEWVALRTTGSFVEYVALCGVEQPGSKLDVRLFARVDDIVPVLARPWSYRADDGASIELAPGVALRRLSSGRFRAQTPELTVDIAVDDSWTTRFFPTEPRFRTRKPVAWGRGPMDVRVGELEVHFPDPEIGFDAVESVGGSWRLARVGTCTSVVGRGQLVSVEHQPGHVLAAPIEGASIPAATQLTWPDDSYAGRTLYTVPLDDVTRQTDRGERSCFVSKNFFDGQRAELCVPAAAVQRE